MTRLALWQEEVEEVVQAVEGGPDMNRVILLSLMVLLPTVATLIVVYGGLRLKGLLARIPRITKPEDVDAYRTEAALHRTLGAAIKPLLVSLPFRAVEAQAMALPCANEDLRKSYLDAVNG